VSRHDVGVHQRGTVRRDLPKGDALASIRLAGIMGAKRTPDLIPLCHPVAITGVEVRVEPHSGGARIEATVRTRGQTGVEMEAMTAVSVAALTLYDMVKGVEKGVEIGPIATVCPSRAVVQEPGRNDGCAWVGTPRRLGLTDGSCGASTHIHMLTAPFLIAALVLATIWGIYLFPSISGGRKEAPLNSTEDFDRWTHLMADVQRRAMTPSRVTARDVVRSRRRRALVAWSSSRSVRWRLHTPCKSIGWLLVHLTIDAVIAWYIGMLMQVRHQREARAAETHVANRPTDADAPQVRIVAGQ
jgi:molybdenum cofactor biosynthesis protein MoaC